ncbi:efflux RND transporter periplasmic adaptor subunit [Arenibacterium sp. CAU 1754]
MFGFRKSSKSFAALAAFFWIAAIATPVVAQETTAPSVVRAKAEATISSVLSGTLDDLAFDEGDPFSKGDVLARLDCAIQHAEAEAARADAEAARSTFASRQALFSRGGIGRSEVEIAKASSAAADARTRGAEARLKGCQIVAPFDGKISEKFVNQFEYVQPAQPLFSIVSSGRPDIEIIAPTIWLRWMKIGQIGRLRLNAVEGTFDIRVTGLGSTVDPVSRTVKISAAFENDVPNILPGMSGLVNFEQPQ